MKKSTLPLLLCLCMLFAMTAAGDGLLPGLPGAGGTAMPSLIEVLHRYPDSEETLADGSAVEEWSGVTAEDYNAFSVLLSQKEVTLQDSSYDNGVIDCTMTKGGQTFAFTFDSVQQTARVVYSLGCYDGVLFSAKSVWDVAEAAETAGDYEAAAEKYASLKAYEGCTVPYRDSDVCEKRCYYKSGEAKRAAQDWRGATAAFRKAGDYSDASTQVYATYYAQGEAKRDAKDWNGAVTAFEKAGEYRDAATQINATRYEEGKAKRKAKDWNGAVAAFKKAGEYKDAATQIKATRYAEGADKLKAKNWKGAITAFRQAGDYGKAKTQIKETRYQQANSLYKAGKYTQAMELYQELKGYKKADTYLNNSKEKLYQQANALYKAQRYPEAVEIYKQIKGYKRADSFLDSATQKNKKVKESFKKVGSVVSYGRYPQGKMGTDKTPIDWVVLAYSKKTNRALVISRYGLDAVPFNTKWVNTSWEKSTIRRWLNKDFLTKAFTNAEQAAIVTTTVNNGESQGYWKTKGKNTKDQIFLLSYAEAGKYFGISYKKPTTKANTKSTSTKGMIALTAHAIKQGAWVSNSYKTDGNRGTGYWWLRTSGYVANQGMYVGTDGELHEDSVSNTHYAVRPAFWLDLNKLPE